MSDEAADFEDFSEEKLLQIPSHRTTWDQKDLLANILSRYFQVVGELGGTRWPVWKVDVKAQNDVHESVIDLNFHLKNLGWMAKLQNGDPWLLQIIPLPERQFPSIKTTVSFWSLSILTATIAGMVWLDGSRPDSGWFANSLFVDSLLGYTIPIFSIILFASFVQRYHAKRNGLRIGHLTPIPEPSVSLFSLGILSKSMLIWPFGILLIPSLPRMDARPWKDRTILGWSAIIVPSIMIVFGMILWLIGLILTPEIVTVTSVQYVSEMPLLVNLLSSIFIDGVESKSVWAHPFSKAGAMLCFFGWISLLPVPTFPGGRLMIARTGMSEARNSTNQLFLFGVILVFAWMFEAFGSFNIWLPVLGVIFPLILFMGADRRIPIILDEPKGMENDTIRRLGICLFAIFLLGLPAQTPFQLDDDWDDDIYYEFSDSITIFETNQSWSGSIEIKVINPSSIVQDWQLSLGTRNDVVSQHWDFVWECSDDEKDSVLADGCGDYIKPSMESTVKLHINWKSETFSPFSENFYLITYLGDQPNVDQIKIKPDLDVYPDSKWQIIYDSKEIKRCIKLNFDSEINSNVTFSKSDSDYNFQTRMYWIEGDSDLSTEINSQLEQLCIKGQDPVVLLRSHVLDIIQIDNYSFNPDAPSLQDKLISPINGTYIDSTPQRGWGSNFNSGDILSISQTECQLEPKVSTPTKPDNISQQWVWNTNYRDTALMPAIQENDSILLVVDDLETIIICSENMYPEPKKIISVEEGPELVLERNGNFYRLWTSIWASAANGSGPNLSEFSIHNHDNNSIRVNIVQTTSGNGSEEWQIESSVTELIQGENKFSFIPPQSILSTMWLNFEDGEVYIYLGSYS